ncbi:tRNA(His) guanylyltransferase 2-like isoform X3 [Actinidia eriantha]|uniref:tRNA(His) guanylyltransferase 2-like isoform X3 n=1 Tax=Actinidia eriantha TaxID=165200 RepID=UPI0025866B57|nr:tRNA(His) guanylyltransferase 2-like isoform X3 [Actinidia eriantha]
MDVGCSGKGNAKEGNSGGHRIRCYGYWRKFLSKYYPSLPLSSHLCSSQNGKNIFLRWRSCPNQYNTCLWMLIRSGKTEREAREIFVTPRNPAYADRGHVMADGLPAKANLPDTHKQEKHELLFQQFGINYKKLPSMFCQGSCVLKRELCFEEGFSALSEACQEANPRSRRGINEQEANLKNHRWS